MSGFKVEPYNRPEFMILLGLKPPYTPEDVKHAYRQKAKTAHPDLGGDAETYMQLHSAYEQALDYASFHSKRREWIGDEIEPYIKRQEIINDVESRGGHVTIQRREALRPWVGEDFGQLKDRLIAIHLRGPNITDEALKVMIENADVLDDLEHLDLAHSQISSDGLLQLDGLSNLTALDLHDTPIDNQGMEIIARLPKLEWLHVGGTKVNWRGRMKMKFSRPQLHVATETPKHHRR